MKQDEFKGDKKLPIISLTGSLERQLIEATIHKIPRWIEGYHLTLMTIIWSAGLIFSVIWRKGTGTGCVFFAYGFPAMVYGFV